MEATTHQLYEQVLADFCSALDACEGMIVLPSGKKGEKRLTGAEYLERFKTIKGSK